MSTTRLSELLKTRLAFGLCVFFLSFSTDVCGRHFPRTELERSSSAATGGYDRRIPVTRNRELKEKTKLSSCSNYKITNWEISDEKSLLFTAQLIYR